MSERSRKVWRGGLFTGVFLCTSLGVRELVLIRHPGMAVCNPGGPFGWSLPLWWSDAGAFLMIGFLVFFWWQATTFRTEWLWLLLGAAGLSNLIERVGFGCVVDYVPFFFRFNLADAALAFGTATLIVVTWHHRRDAVSHI